MIHLLWLSLAIPVVIHLVHRRKAMQVPFSTLRFVRMVDRRVARRHRLKELLLLAARMLLLAALIGALYRPMARSATFQGRGVPTAAAIVLDNTMSMHGVHGGTTRFERARRAAAQILDGLRDGDAACLVFIDEPGAAEAEMTTSLSALRNRLEAAECGYGGAAAAGALGRALRAVAADRRPRKELYVISDFQRVTWTDAVGRLRGQVPESAPVFLVDVSGDVEKNLALTRAEPALRVQVAGAALDVLCTVANRGAGDARSEVSLLVNGEVVAQDEAGVPAGGVAELSLRHIPAAAGELAAEVRLEPDDLAPDNARYLVLPVQQKLRVLLVDGAPSAVPYRAATFYMEMALRAPARGGETLSPVETTVIPPAELPHRRLAEYACVVMANVAEPSELWADRLTRYVEDGGGLIVFPGPLTDADSWNAAWGDGLMPARLGEVVEVPEGSALGRLDGSHPVFAGLDRALDPRRLRVERFYAIEEPQGPVLARLREGPLLVERRFGAGSVLQFTTAADLEWGNLPARPFFLPMLHQMVYYVGRPGRAPAEVTVGTPYALKLPADAAGARVAFYGPGDDEEPLAIREAEPADGGARVLFEQTHRPGFYRADWEQGERAHGRLFAVNTEPDQSRTERLDPEQARAVLGARHARVVDDVEDLARVVRREREGLPLWNYLLAAALALAVVESFVGNAWLKRRGAR